MIDAGNFGLRMIKADTSSFVFGINTRAELAAVLHQFADDVASGSILVQRVQTGSVLNAEDFLTRAIMIEYAERLEAPGE